MKCSIRLMLILIFFIYITEQAIFSKNCLDDSSKPVFWSIFLDTETDFLGFDAIKNHSISPYDSLPRSFLAPHSKISLILSDERSNVSSAVDFFIQHNVPENFLNILFNDVDLTFPVLELSEGDLKALDNDSAVQQWSGFNLFSYEEMQAFSLNRKHQGLWESIKTVLKLKGEFSLPLILIKKGSGIISLTHEVTHCNDETVGYEGTNMSEYVLNPRELRAFLNSILMFRFLYPMSDFYDFVREQSDLDKKDFPNDFVDRLLKSSVLLRIEKEIWKELDGLHVTEDNLSECKTKLWERILAKRRKFYFFPIRDPVDLIFVLFQLMDDLSRSIRHYEGILNKSLGFFPFLKKIAKSKRQKFSSSLHFLIHRAA